MRVDGVIEQRLSRNTYLVRDSGGKTHRATSVDLWRPGDPVVVLDGQIVGRAAPRPKALQIEV